MDILELSAVLVRGCLIHDRMIHFMSTGMVFALSSPRQATGHACTLLMRSLTWASCGVSAACAYSVLCQEVEWAGEPQSRPEGSSAGRGWEGDVKWRGPAVAGSPVVHLELQPHAGKMVHPDKLKGRSPCTSVFLALSKCQNMNVKLSEHHFCSMLKWKLRVSSGALSFVFVASRASECRLKPRKNN